VKTANGIVKTPVGLILYEGKSLLDGKQIVVIANGFLKSENEKTGSIIQTWILVKDTPPIQAHQEGKDFSVCGDCKHRHFGSCYVNLLYGPNPVYRAYKNGSYRKMTIDDMIFFKDKTVRLGSYGDPSSTPMYVWDSILAVAKNALGYTHQWLKCDQNLKKYCMASVDSITNYYPEKQKAQNLGWRTFRVREDSDTLIFPDEMICPASHEAGQITTCKNCGNCSGSQSNRKNPVIINHGWSKGNKTYVKGMKKIKNKKAWKKTFAAIKNVIKNDAQIPLQQNIICDIMLQPV
jgi:hypothetical protein